MFRVGGFAEERASVLEVIAHGNTSERLAWRQRIAVARVDVADLPLRNRDQRASMHAILPLPQTEMQTTAKQIGLVAGLAVERDDAAFRHGAGLRPKFFDNTDLRVRHVANAHSNRDDHEEHDSANGG